MSSGRAATHAKIKPRKDFSVGESALFDVPRDLSGSEGNSIVPFLFGQ